MKVTRENGGNKIVIEADNEEMLGIFTACSEILGRVYGDNKDKFELTKKQRTALSILAFSIPKNRIEPYSLCAECGHGL